MKIKTLVIACILLVLSPWSMAQEGQEQNRDRDGERSNERDRDRDRDRDGHRHRDPSYSYIEVATLDHGMTLNGEGVDPDGSKFELSLALGDSLFGVLDRKRSSGNPPGGSFDFDTDGYGFGLRGDSWFASYTYNTWDLADNEFDVDTIRVGFRDMWSDRFEFNASYTWNDIDGADNEDGFQVGIAYRISNNFHLVADYETIGGNFDIDSVSAGVRFSF